MDPYSSLKGQLDIFLTIIDKLMQKFSTIREKVDPDIKLRKFFSGVVTAVGIVGTSVYLGGRTSPQIGLISTTFTLLGGLYFLKTSNESRMLVKSVQRLVRDFDIGISSIEPVIERIGEILKSQANEIPAFFSAEVRIKKYMNIILNEVDKELGPTKAALELDEIIEQISSLFTGEQISLEAETYMRAIIKLLRICDLLMIIYNKEVTVELIDLIVEKLEDIKRDYSTILNQLKLFEANDKN